MNEKAVKSPALEVLEEEGVSELEEQGSVKTETQGGFFGSVSDSGFGFRR